MPKPPTIRVCFGKDCRKKRGAHRKLLAALEAHAIKPVRCQKVCKGPVVGLKVDGTLEWFGRMRKKVDRKRLLMLVDKKRLERGLAKKAVRKRRGKER